MIAQEDLELFPWLVGANSNAGHFLKALTQAALLADFENYPLIRPTLLVMREKYPKFGEDELERMRKDGFDG